MANLDICVRFGRRIQRERKKRNLKQIDLSVATGMTRSTISQIENGRQEVGLRTIEKLAKGIDIPMISLFRNL
jgi:transcriptional regulator with XRE-family HTH domain